MDFKGVSAIGQAFADELFRVFKLDHPEVELFPINMSDDVKKMVFRASMSSVITKALRIEN
ncbi:STAS-like domain-containing protein [Methylomusa anaerophila]|uniref:STAS-like domain-containing protein n=1 Tax=Methylomusa anaerophila TaxID=1930071 RepID=UPI003A521EDC